MKIENLKDLELLRQTARAGSLSAAARALDLSPAAASAGLQRLERQLGARLFERSTRSMRLTEAGQTLLDYAQRALDLLAEGEAQIDDTATVLTGWIRVAAPSDLARTRLLPLFGQFQAQHPGVRLALSVSDRPQDLLRDEIDLALRYGELADSRLVARPLTISPRVLCAAPAYLARHGTPVHPQDLRRHNCLVFHRAGRPHRQWRFQRDGQWVEVRVDGDRTVDDASIATAWGLEGAGLLLRSALELRHLLDEGRLTAVMGDWQAEPYPLHALLPSGRFIPARVRALVEHLARGLGDPAGRASVPST